MDLATLVPPAALIELGLFFKEFKQKSQHFDNCYATCSLVCWWCAFSRFALVLHKHACKHAHVWPLNDPHLDMSPQQQQKPSTAAAASLQAVAEQLSVADVCGSVEVWCSNGALDSLRAHTQTTPPGSDRGAIPSDALQAAANKSGVAANAGRSEAVTLLWSLVLQSNAKVGGDAGGQLLLLTASTMQSALFAVHQDVLSACSRTNKLLMTSAQGTPQVHGVPLCISISIPFALLLQQLCQQQQQLLMLSLSCPVLSCATKTAPQPSTAAGGPAEAVPPSTPAVAAGRCPSRPTGRLCSCRLPRQPHQPPEVALRADGIIISNQQGEANVRQQRKQQLSNKLGEAM